MIKISIKLHISTVHTFELVEGKKKNKVKRAFVIGIKCFEEKKTKHTHTLTHSYLIKSAVLLGKKLKIK